MMIGNHHFQIRYEFRTWNLVRWQFLIKDNNSSVHDKISIVNSKLSSWYLIIMKDIYQNDTNSNMISGIKHLHVIMPYSKHERHWRYQSYLITFQAYARHLSIFQVWILCIYLRHANLSSIYHSSPPLSSTKRRIIQQYKCGRNSSKFHTNVSKQ